MSLSELRVFGRSGTPVSPLTLGTMNFGEGSGSQGGARQGAPTGAEESIRIIHAALDAGITAVDTADVYSQGESEQVVGRALRGRRDDVFLATKFHGQMNSNPAHSGNSRRWIMQAVEGSLRRLQTDRIDLYQAHRPDYNTDVLETITTLNDLIRQGKILYYGTSVFTPAQLVEAQWLATTNHLIPPLGNQVPYSMLVRGNERDVLPIAQQYGLGVLAYGPLAGGWLSGNFTLEAGKAATKVHSLPGRYDISGPSSERKLRAADALARLADKLELPLVELAMGFALTHPAISSVIIGPRNEEHLQAYLRAADVRLSEAVLDAIDDVVPPGTNFMERDAGAIVPSLEFAELRRR
ncbi:aldo/keto reductase [Pseudarthrobacter sp. NamE5]|uniref:aldo/keto reductase n=1 Tax=Pseudarthrobacter sp. NamE5 TaxID=2576839 RepID=UPI00110A5AFF|nr:aldo/keto reductase [Pseudarthrobacter sp. NamE5]TLM88015.1 aldo/keto reductase [Pseudarthrobacter sp. NamE5]